MGDYPGLSKWSLNAIPSVFLRGGQREVGHKGGKVALLSLKKDKRGRTKECKECSSRR